MDFPTQMSANAAPHYPVNHFFNSRFPKLNLPVFNGDPLEWLSFWDSFNLGVNSKPVLLEEGRIGYWLRGHEGERNNCFSKIQLVGQKYRE